MLRPDVSGGLHDTSVRRKVAAENREPARGVERCCGCADDVLSRRLSCGCRFLGERPARDGRRGSVQKPCLGQSLHEQPRSTRAMEVGRNIAPAWFQIGNEGNAPADQVEVVERERNAGFPGDRQQVQDGVGRSAGRGHRSNRVVEGGPRDEPAGADALPDEIHHQRAGRSGDVRAPGIEGRPSAAPERRNAQEFADRRHGVCRELAAARPGTGTRAVLECTQVGLGHAAGRARADRLVHVLDGHIAAAEAAGRDRSPVEHEAGDIQPRQRHDRGGNGLVAADQRDHAIELIGPRDELDRIGDHLAAHERRAHAFGAHRDAVGHRNRVELERRAAGGADAFTDPVRHLAQVVVARADLDPGVGDADERAGQILVGQARGFQHRPGRGPVGPGSQRRASSGVVGAHDIPHCSTGFRRIMQTNSFLKSINIYYLGARVPGAMHGAGCPGARYGARVPGAKVRH